MAYANLADIQAEFKSLPVTATTQLQSATINEFIDDASAEIDGKLGVRYTVPVTTGASALAILKTICTWLVKDRIRGVLEIKDVQEKVDQDVAGKSLRERALEWLDSLAKGHEILPGAPLLPSGGGVESYNRSRVDQNVFHRGRDEW